jgi:hypothetical protein
MTDTNNSPDSMQLNHLTVSTAIDVQAFAFDGTIAIGQDPHQKRKIENIAAVRIRRQMREQPL